MVSAVAVVVLAAFAWLHAGGAPAPAVPAAPSGHGGHSACLTALESGPGLGVSIQGQPVRLPGPAIPGASYRLGVYVADIGSVTEVITLRTLPYDGCRRHGRDIPQSWLAARPLTLSPGQGTTEALTLRIPPGAHPGRYVAALIAYASVAGAQPGSGGSAQLGAGAGTLIIVHVRLAPAAPHVTR